MKKLTAKEILEIVEKNYSVESFAYGEWGETKFVFPVSTHFD